MALAGGSFSRGGEQAARQVERDGGYVQGEHRLLTGLDGRLVSIQQGNDKGRWRGAKPAGYAKPAG
jgi:hypothetical protein